MGPKCLDGWGGKSTAAVLGIYGHLEAIPSRADDWQVQPRTATRLAAILQKNFKLALLFRDLATLRTKEPVIRSPNEVRWRQPGQSFPSICKHLDDSQLVERVAKLAA